MYFLRITDSDCIFPADVNLYSLFVFVETLHYFPILRGYYLAQLFKGKSRKLKIDADNHWLTLICFRTTNNWIRQTFSLYSKTIIVSIQLWTFFCDNIRGQTISDVSKSRLKIVTIYFALKKFFQFLTL